MLEHICQGEVELGECGRAEFTKDMKRADNKTGLYLCQKFVCGKPITDIDEVFEALTGLDPHTSD